MSTFQASIFSPRWGHDDTYTLDLTNDKMTISDMSWHCDCIWQEGRDPTWSNDSLDSHLRNDSIYAPRILPDLLEHLWKSWRDCRLNDQQTQLELDEIIGWLNATSRAKPKSVFWAEYF